MRKGIYDILRKNLVTVVQNALGDWGFRCHFRFRHMFGMQYWSLSSYLKSKVKGAIQVVNNFDELVVRKCLVEGHDGIIYGHTHTPDIKKVKTKLIMNDGDVCENMTCLVEMEDGKFQLIRMTDNTILKEI